SACRERRLFRKIAEPILVAAVLWLPAPLFKTSMDHYQTIVAFALVGAGVVCLVLFIRTLRRTPAWRLVRELNRQLTEATRNLEHERSKYVETRWDARTEHWIKTKSHARFRTFKPTQDLSETVRWMREVEGGQLQEIPAEQYQALIRLEDA